MAEKVCPVLSGIYNGKGDENQELSQETWDRFNSENKEGQFTILSNL